MISPRRKFIRMIGSTALIWGAADCPCAAAKDGKDPYAAWNGPGAREQDVRRWALAYAILAPNPHNLQPWIVDLETPNEITLYHDSSRLLPQTDPYGRQLMIGHGAFLELLEMAARQRGMRLNIKLFPFGEHVAVMDSRPIARIVLIADPAIRPDPLFSFVPRRRTNRAPYAMQRAIARPDLDGVCAASGSAVRTGYSTNPDTVRALRELTLRAWDIELAIPRTWGESVDLTRIGDDEIAAHPDGVSLRGLMIAGAKLLGLLSRAKMADPSAFFYRQSLEFGREALRNTPAFVWVVSAGNTRQLQVESGRGYVRMQLAAHGAGLSMHPASQALQEYPEMAKQNGALKQVLDLGPEQTVQMLARIGYGPDVDPAPRWPLDHHLIGGRRT